VRPKGEICVTISGVKRRITNEEDYLCETRDSPSDCERLWRSLILFVTRSYATTEKVLHNFLARQAGRLISDASGNLYGTTEYGGDYGDAGYGQVF
jgi:hypothetical protein